MFLHSGLDPELDAGQALAALKVLLSPRHGRTNIVRTNPGGPQGSRGVVDVAEQSSGSEPVQIDRPNVPGHPG